MSVLLVVAVVAATLPWTAIRRPGGVDPADDRSGASTGRWRLGTGRVAAAGSRGRADDGPARRTAWRRRAASSADADPALLLDLVAVALAAGAAVPAALATVGAAWPGPDGQALVRAARALELGAPWDVAWPQVGTAVRETARALEPAWTAGASPVPLLRAAADRQRSRRRAAVRAAAGRLGVQLVVPLGVCYLPAFVLVGLVPVVVSLASGLLR